MAQRRREPDDSAALEARYDAIAYPTNPNSSTHPDRLATVARLCGLRPAPPERCSLLEVGCGDGGNLIAMAYALPGSRFLGIDLAGAPIERGRAVIAELGLENIELRKADLRELGPEDGTFDYITAHGVYSWVPVEVREALLALCGTNLAPMGVAYVSYNALPGGRVRQMLREMMRFHVRHLRDPMERVAGARALLELLADPGDASLVPDAVRALMAEQARMMAERTDADIFHDDLADINDAIAITEFAGAALRHGLQFLGEADYFEMEVARFAPPVASQLREMAAQNIVLKEQYLDFLKARQFRKTLLCRTGIPVHHGFDPDAVAELYAWSDAQQVEDEDGSITFQSPDRGGLTTKDPLAVAAFAVLGEAHPGAVGFGPLLDRTLAGMAEDVRPSKYAGTRRLAELLHRSYAMGLIELHTRPPFAGIEPGERPRASALARLQARDRDERFAPGQRANPGWAPAYVEVTNLRHENVRLEGDLSRMLLQLLDGTRTREQLVEAIVAVAGEARRDEITANMEPGLRALASLGLLEA
jgi:SAM-dependent methyltransferase